MVLNKFKFGKRNCFCLVKAIVTHSFENQEKRKNLLLTWSGATSADWPTANGLRGGIKT